MTASRGGKQTAAGPAATDGAAPGGAPGDVQELRQEIEQTRERLGATVEQLVAKTDLKGRAQAKAAALARQVQDNAVKGASAAKQHRVPLMVAAGTSIAGCLVLLWWRKR
jgi:Protein of unknown function (DUF3618)